MSVLPLLLLACIDLPPSTPPSSPSTPSVPSPPTDTGEPSGSTADTGLPTTDTGQRPADTGNCTPTAVVGPTGGLPKIDAVGVAGTVMEWDSTGDTVFQLDGVVGAGTTGLNTGWVRIVHHTSLIPTPVGGDTYPADFAVRAGGDVTGDGLEDLVLVSWGAGQIDTANPLVPHTLVVPGPLDAASTPLDATPGAIWLDGAAVGRPFTCGDLDGDGLAELCGSNGVDRSPPDGALDLTWSMPEAVFVAADLDGDGRNEVYAGSTDTIDRLPTLPGVTGLPEATLDAESNAGSLSVVDLDSDGRDELLWSTGGQARRLEEGDLVAGTWTVQFTHPEPDLHFDDGDFDGDGTKELVRFITDYNALSGTSRGVYPHISTQQGVPLVLLDHGGQHDARTSDVGDIDGDGRDDIVFGAPGGDGSDAWMVLGPTIDCLP